MVEIGIYGVRVKFFGVRYYCTDLDTYSDPLICDNAQAAAPCSNRLSLRGGLILAWIQTSVGISNTNA